nr:RNA polymerase subunit sigma-70 [Kibdelosporangium sp. MJ126-NF4]CEL19473.1 RNA polymerase sigma-70 factor [Kibdelosporangium sp. MJ126-NF4]CTQ94729.1 RNA polymerase sigma-70 factor [Kibdelosporangium sp. MJ126-NF4]
MTQVDTSSAADFADVTEPHRRELLAHCYRMLGSVDEAEDLVQETYLKAWRARDEFEHRSSIRTWLYRIATNSCLSALRRHDRRVLPSGLGTAEEEALWVQLIPDGLIVGESGDDPAEASVARESVRLALIACVQHLPPLQRAVFLLREVLEFKASEVAHILGSSTPAVKSALQRARTRVQDLDPSVLTAEVPSALEERELLDAFITAFETADIETFTRLLSSDAALEIPPSTTWYSGLAACLPVLERAVGRPGDWVLVPSAANGQPAAASYRRDADGVYRAFGAAVLTVDGSRIVRIVSYDDASLVSRFGLPAVHSGAVR